MESYATLDQDIIYTLCLFVSFFCYHAVNTVYIDFDIYIHVLWLSIVILFFGNLRSNYFTIMIGITYFVFKTLNVSFLKFNLVSLLQSIRVVFV